MFGIEKLENFSSPLSNLFKKSFFLIIKWSQNTISKVLTLESQILILAT